MLKHFIFTKIIFLCLLCIEKDPGIEFVKPETQNLLKSITRIDLERIFRKRTVAKNAVTYKFMTTEEIQNEIKKAAGTAKKFLQMPPITKVIFVKYKYTFHYYHLLFTYFKINTLYR